MIGRILYYFTQKCDWYFEGYLSTIPLVQAPLLKLFLVSSSMLQLPFTDLALAAYNFLLTTSMNRWSLKKFAGFPGRTTSFPVPWAFKYFFCQICAYCHCIVCLFRPKHLFFKENQCCTSLRGQIKDTPLRDRKRSKKAQHLAGI